MFQQWKKLSALAPLKDSVIDAKHAYCSLWVISMVKES